MSGAGRKHRAKHLTRQYLDSTGWVGPLEGESLAVCLESPHGGHVRVLLLLAKPSAVSPTSPDAVNGAVPKQESTPAPSGCGAAPTGEAVQEVRDDVDLLAYAKEQLVFLPGKFHKVIWLSIKDIVVVSDGTVTFKPSPEQIAIFLRDPANAGWPERIAAAQLRAEEQRVAVQRMPQYGATTTTTTSVLTGPQVQRDVPASGEEAGAMSGSEEDADEFVNPNRQNIKHHQQFFYGMDDDDSDEEEEDEEEEKTA